MKHKGESGENEWGNDTTNTIIMKIAIMDADTTTHFMPWIMYSTRKYLILVESYLLVALFYNYLTRIERKLSEKMHTILRSVI